VATASINRPAAPLAERLQKTLNGDVRGVPVAIILMLLAGAAAGGVAALTTHVFEPEKTFVAPSRLGPSARN